MGWLLEDLQSVDYSGSSSPCNIFLNLSNSWATPSPMSMGYIWLCHAIYHILQKPWQPSIQRFAPWQEIDDVVGTGQSFGWGTMKSTNDNWCLSKAQMGTPQPDAILGLVYQGDPQGTAGVCKGLDPQQGLLESRLHQKKTTTRHVFKKPKIQIWKKVSNQKFRCFKAYIVCSTLPGWTGDHALGAPSCRLCATGGGPPAQRRNSKLVKRKIKQSGDSQF